MAKLKDFLPSVENRVERFRKLEEGAKSHNPIPGAYPIDGAITSAKSIGTEALKRLVKGQHPFPQLIRAPTLAQQRAKHNPTMTWRAPISIKLGVEGAPVKENKSTVSRIQGLGIDIYFVDIDQKDGTGNYTNDLIQLQSIPRNLLVEPEANWNPINSMARNNPFYHYTGGEDTLTLTLDWYADKLIGGKEDTQRIGPIMYAKWLEAKCRNDGLEEPPHRLKFLWGESANNTTLFKDMFSESTWIVAEAPYTMSMFHKEHGLRPTQIIQQVILKRVTDHNRTTFEVKHFY